MGMKKLRLLLAVALSLFAFSTVSHAAVVNGTVFCDANQDSLIDTGDPGIPGVLVVITNENNSFSNSAVTGVDGSFSIQIPDPDASAAVRDPLSQIFVETLDPASLPDSSSIILPLANTNLTSTPAYFISFATTATQTNLVFNSGTGNSSTGNWLINNPECGSVGNCKLSGGGRINGFEVIEHNFSGKILSGNPPSGKWTDISRSRGLELRSTAIQTVSCGTDSVEFTGTGNLFSIQGGNPRLINNSVQFTAEIQNLSVGNGRRNRTVSAYFLDVTTSDGTTIELVSEDQADPTDIAPVPISLGHFNIQSE